jgi:hypothetical protein
MRGCATSRSRSGVVFRLVSWAVSKSRREKLLQKMQKNPRDWRIEDLKRLAQYFAIDYDETGSHVTFRSVDGRRATVPEHKPIKPVYIPKFLELIEAGNTNDQD